MSVDKTETIEGLTAKLWNEKAFHRKTKEDLVVVREDRVWQRGVIKQLKADVERLKKLNADALITDCKDCPFDIQVGNVKQLQAENAERIKEYQEAMADVDACTETIHQLTAVLERYGRHDKDCAWAITYGSVDCSCGFDQAKGGE